MKRIEKRKNAAIEFAKQGDLGGSYNDRYDGFMAGSQWERNNPIGVLDEDYAWAIYNFINEWKDGKFGEIGLQKALLNFKF